MKLNPSDPDVSMADLHDRPFREHTGAPTMLHADTAGGQTPHESDLLLIPCQPGHYHVRILRTPGLIGTSLKLLVPNQVRHDTPTAVVVSIPADNPYHLAVGDYVILNMKEGGYGFEKQKFSDEQIEKFAIQHPNLTYQQCLDAMGQESMAADTKYLVHPGTLMFADFRGHNHFMVSKDDILVRIEKEHAR